MRKLRDRDKKDHAKLEGRIIKWKFSRLEHGKVFYGRIVGCHYDIGVTIVNDQNPEQNLTCMNGRLSPNGQKWWIENTNKQFQYDVGFQYLLECVRENKVYDCDEKLDRQHKSHKGNGNLFCAFGS